MELLQQYQEITDLEQLVAKQKAKIEKVLYANVGCPQIFEQIYKRGDLLKIKSISCDLAVSMEIMDILYDVIHDDTTEHYMSVSHMLTLLQPHLHRSFRGHAMFNIADAIIYTTMSRYKCEEFMHIIARVMAYVNTSNLYIRYCAYADAEFGKGKIKPMSWPFYHMLRNHGMPHSDKIKIRARVLEN